MMKLSDVSTATALVIQGYMRANGEDNLATLATVIQTIRQECDDWAENLENHKRPDGTFDDQD